MHIVKVLNKPGATNERNLVETIIHVGTNDLSNGINFLNDVKKVLSQINSEQPKANIAFSSIINRKTRKSMGKNVTETNHRLKKYRKQNDLIYIDNANINEVRLGVKKAPPKYLRYLSNV